MTSLKSQGQTNAVKEKCEYIYIIIKELGLDLYITYLTGDLEVNNMLQLRQLKHRIFYSAVNVGHTCENNKRHQHDKCPKIHNRQKKDSFFFFLILLLLSL